MQWNTTGIIPVKTMERELNLLREGLKNNSEFIRWHEHTPIGGQTVSHPYSTSAKLFFGKTYANFVSMICIQHRSRRNDVKVINTLENRSESFLNRPTKWVPL